MSDLMYNVVERLEGLRVADVMTREVTTIRSSCTMGEAAQILHSSKSTGAPVVDEKGRCQGVLSANDFLRLKSLQHESMQHGATNQEFQLTKSGRDGTFGIKQIEEDEVRQQMTTAVQTIDLHAPLLLAARTMCAAHIHRLIVLNENSHPIGIVSSLDVASALISAIDEQKQTASPTKKG